MSLYVYTAEPFITTNRAGQSSTFTTNGVSATYDVEDTPMAEVGGTVEYGNVQKRLYNGGFTKDDGDETVTFNEVPPAGLQGVIPATRAIVFDSYDTDTVSGVVDPRICVSYAYIGNVDDIANYSYIAKTGVTGIRFYVQDNITSVGPDVSWYQMAVCDASGVAGTYMATGATASMNPISATAALAASGASGSWTITLTGTGSGTDIFQAADYIIINPGEVTSEIRRINSIAGNVLTLTSGLDSNHDADEGVFVCVRQYAIKQTVPEGATLGEAQTFWNATLEVLADKIQRE